VKTIILYATKYGATKEIAERVAKLISGAVVHDVLDRDTVPSLNDFDCVILGSSLCAGSIRKEMKAYLKASADELQGKRIGLFLSGFAEKEADKAFEKNFLKVIKAEVVSKGFLGGIFDPEKVGKTGRFLMRIVAKIGYYTNTISDEAIKKFVKDLQGEEK